MVKFDLKEQQHNCFKCGTTNKLEIERPMKPYECIVKKMDVVKVKPVFIEKNKAEIEYTCKECRSINKITIDI